MSPDIDVDFEHQRREEVLQYIYEKYGRERSGMTAEVIKYRPRSAVRDVGKALGLSLDRVDVLAKGIDHTNTGESLAGRFRAAGVDCRTRTIKLLIHLVREILGFRRSTGRRPVHGTIYSHGPAKRIAARREQYGAADPVFGGDSTVAGGS